MPPRLSRSKLLALPARGWALALLALALATAALAAAAVDWTSSPDLHSILEVVACLMAGFAGTVALVRHLAKREAVYLLVGAGLLGAAALDGYHMVVTSRWFADIWPSPPPSLIPWSWNASRTLLGMIMVLTWWTGTERGRGFLPSDRAVLSTVVGLTLSSFAVSAFVALPRAYYPELPVGRPQDLLPAALFLVALAGELRRGAWRVDAFRFWLVASLVTGLATQLVMAFSFGLFDTLFDLAHGLKIASYACVLTGMTLGTFHTFRRESEAAEQLRVAHRDLLAHAGELSLAERTLKAERGLLRTLIDNLPDPIYVKNRRSEFILANASTAQLMGAASPDDLMGRTDRDFHPAALAAEFLQDEKRVIETGEAVVDKTERVTGPGGEERWLLTTKVALREADGRINGIVGIGRDITGLRRAEITLVAKNEQLARVNTELRNFANASSHDLQEPLRKIRAFSDRLQDRHRDALPENARDYLDRIHRSAARMSTLIEDLLAFSRLENGCRPPERVDLNVVVDGVLADLEIAIEAAGATVTCDSLPTLWADATQMGQLFQNLVGNAIKFRRPGVAARVHISCRRAPAAADPFGVRVEQVMIGVEDNGIGFEPRYAERIFQVFHRLHGRDEFPGTGVGLGICKKIVEGHGGHISALGRPGEGSTFTVVLPFGAASVTPGPEPTVAYG